MNRVLITTLSSLNIVYAILIVAGFAYVGNAAGTVYRVPFGLGAVAGAVIGVVFASFVCGVISFLTMMEKHPHHLVKSADYQNQMARIAYERDKASSTP